MEVLRVVGTSLIDPRLDLSQAAFNGELRRLLSACENRKKLPVMPLLIGDEGRFSRGFKLQVVELLCLSAAA